MNICIYGTVYNNVSFIEESIKSVWRPDAEIVIVDNYSTDGTWEELMRLRKEYNLRIYRYRSSRGLGRNIALMKCSEGSLALYFDLDTIYNDAFHKLIDYATMRGGRLLSNGTLVAKREYLISRGGWRDLNYGEDIEFISRVEFDEFVPTLIGMNAAYSPYVIVREKRYGGFKRLIKTSIDVVRGDAYSFRRLLIERSKRIVLFYLPARLLGFYRNKSPDNPTWIEKMCLIRSVPLKDVGVDDKYFFYVATLTLLRELEDGEETIDRRVKMLTKTPIIKAYTRSRAYRIMYFKDHYFIDWNLLPLIEKLSII